MLSSSVVPEAELLIEDFLLRSTFGAQRRRSSLDDVVVVVPLIANAESGRLQRPRSSDNMSMLWRIILLFKQYPCSALLRFISCIASIGSDFSSLPS